MALHGKEAEEFVREADRREMERRTRALASARTEAAASGKEPFDLEKLEELCDTSSEGRLAPLEKRRANFEYQYYVSHPEIRTIAEFAAHVEALNKW